MALVDEKRGYLDDSQQIGECDAQTGRNQFHVVDMVDDIRENRILCRHDQKQRCHVPQANGQPGASGLRVVVVPHQAQTVLLQLE